MSNIYLLTSALLILHQASFKPVTNTQASLPTSFRQILPGPAPTPILEPLNPVNSSGSLASPTTCLPTANDNLQRQRNPRSGEDGFVYPPPLEPDDPFHEQMGADSAPIGGFRGPYYGKAIGK